MAERKPGPVKPPTIDLTARQASGVGEEQGQGRRGTSTEAAEIAADTESATLPSEQQERPSPPPPPPRAEASRPQSPPPPPPREREGGRKAPGAVAVKPGRRGWGPIVGAGIAGALAGTALTYLLATVVPLPVPGPSAPDLGPQLGEQQERLTALEQRLGAIEESSADALATAGGASAATAERLAALETAVAETRESIPAPTDTSALETRLRALASRVDAIAAGASSADAGAMAENIGELEGRLAALQSEVDALGGRSSAAETSLETLTSDVAALRRAAEEAAEAEQAAAPSANLPVIASGLETAFATGRPFATELASLASIDPGIAVDERIALRAGTGLPRPDVLDRQFAEAVPAMLAARPSSSSDLQQSAGDWLTNLLAIRPAGEIEGDSPEAVVSRLESAMTRHDYAGAVALFALLPPEMVVAAGTVPADIAVHATAAELVATIKGKAAAS